MGWRQQINPAATLLFRPRRYWRRLPRSVLTRPECQKRLAVDIDAAVPAILWINEVEQWVLPGVNEMAAFYEPALDH